jgi:toxin ParE1/3/4
MHVRWTGPAADDFVHIVEYVRRDNPGAARRIADTIYKAVALLQDFPLRGRNGIVEETRELVLTPLPYIVVYEVSGNDILVLRIRHAAHDWP